MNRLGRLLQPLIDAEQQSAGPPPQAVADCWERIAADAERGSFPMLDVPPPAPPRSPLLWLSLLVMGATLAGAIAYLSHGATDPLPPATVAVPAPAVPVLAPPAPSESADVATPPASTPAPPEESRKPADPEQPPDPAPRSVPKPRPPRTTTSAPEVEADTFAAELRLLAQGQAALNRGDHADALKIADQYQKTYPKGHFVEDRDALRVVALCGATSPKAVTAARTFLRAHPTSIHAARIRDACALPLDGP